MLDLGESVLHKILVLVKKDLYFNRTVFACFLGGIVFLMVLAIYGMDGDEGSNYYFLFYTCLLSILPVPYSYQLEDNISTRRFMKTWPVTIEEIFTAKYIMCIGFSVVVSGVGLVLFNCLGTEPVSVRLGLVPILISILFADIYMFIVYKWDPHIASISCSFPLLIPLYLLLSVERKIGISGAIFPIKVLIVFATMTAIITFGVQKSAIKIAKRRS